MPGKIEPLGFLFRQNSQANELVHYEQLREGPDDARRPGDRHSNPLMYKLVRISLHQPRSQDGSIRIFKYRIHDADGKNSRENPTDSAARPMNPERVEQVILPKARLDPSDREIRQNAGDESDRHRGHWFFLQKACRRGCRHEAGDGARDGPQGARLPVALPFGEVLTREAA